MNRTALTGNQISPLRQVAANPLYLGSAVAMFLSGLGFSAAAPQIAIFLVRDLGASLTIAGLFYLTNLTAPVAGYLIGSRSDRTGRRSAVPDLVPQQGSWDGRGSRCRRRSGNLL